MLLSISLYLSIKYINVTDEQTDLSNSGLAFNISCPA
jgi:hypothetical protein